MKRTLIQLSVSFGIPHIEYEEDNVDFDECLVSGEDKEASNFSGEEGMECELLGAENDPS